MTQRRIAGTVQDVTLPKTPVLIDGKTYFLCFDLGSLSEAEFAINSELARQGRTDFVNLLFALPVQNLGNTRLVFAASVRKFHPEITYDQALKMVTLDNVWVIAEAIRDAWKLSSPEPDRNPPEAQESR